VTVNEMHAIIVN